MVYVDYSRVEREVDKEAKKQKKKENVEELKYTIIMARDGENATNDGLKQQEDLTIEQEFIRDYYNIPEDEAIKYTLSDKINKKVVLDDQMEEKRYNALIDYISQFISVDKEVYSLNSKFYPKIQYYNDYTKTISDDPLIVKKIRICQLLNQAAHSYDEMLKEIVSYETFDNENVDFKDVKNICTNLGLIYSNSYNNEKKLKIKKKLKEYQIDEERLNENNVIKYIVDNQNYFYNEKIIYIIDIINYLQKNEINMNYGLSEKGDGIIFDIPMYGQVGLHFGTAQQQVLEAFDNDGGIKKYNGYFLNPKNFIIAKADPKLLEKVDFEELNNEEKELYKILTSEAIIENNKPTKIDTEVIEEKNDVKDTNVDAIFLQIKNSLLMLQKELEDIDTEMIDIEQKLEDYKKREEELKLEKSNLENKVKGISTLIDDIDLDESIDNK